MKPTFNVREQSEIYIGPTADILSGVLPEAVSYTHLTLPTNSLV